MTNKLILVYLAEEVNHTCVSQKPEFVVNNNSGFRIIESIATVVTSFWDFSGRIQICKLRNA